MNMKPIYLDYNATTPVEEEVQETILLSLKNEWANPYSSSNLGLTAKTAIESARKEVALAIGADPGDIIFTSGGTEASNMAIYSTVKFNEENGCSNPHVITTNVEHVATSNPIKELEKHHNVSVTEVSVDKMGMLSSSDVISAIKHNTCLITIMLANNETGVIFPIGVISSSLKRVNKDRRERGLPKILFHTDAAQAIGKIKVNVEDLGVDYLTVAGHKFYGPRIGALYARNPGKNTAVYPVIQGGGQERGFRPGTENTPMIVGLGRAAALVYRNLDDYSEHMKKMRDYLQEKLHEAWDDLVVNCDAAPRLPNTANISFRGFHHSGADLLECCNLTIASTAAACHSQSEPSGVLIASGVPRDLAISAVRFSTGRYTSSEEIDEVVRDVKNAIKILTRK